MASAGFRTATVQVRPLARPQHDVAAARGNDNRAVIDKHGKTPLLGPAKNFVPRTAMSPYGLLIFTGTGRASVWPVKQHRTGLQRDFAAGRRKKLVDQEMRALAEPDRRVLAQQHRQSGGYPGLDAIADIERRHFFQRPMLVACVGKRLALDLLDAPGGIGGARSPAESQRRKQGADRSQNVAPAESIVQNRAAISE